MTVHDDDGHLIDVKEHRAVFQLKHRADRKEPFNPGSYDKPGALYQALARLSRMTSAFSAAFAPVEVTKQSDDPVRACADDAIRLWGHLNHHSYFIDGGVLDNKPFTYTIRDMAYRTKDREIDRILFYVEPDPEMFDKLKKAQADDKAKEPTLLNSVLAGALSIPGYESIASDLQLLAEYNARVQQYERVCTSDQKSELLGAPRTLEQLASDWQGSIYVRSRLVQISDRVVDGLLRVEGFDTLLDDGDRQIAKVLVKVFHDDHEAKNAGLRLDPADTLTSFDVYFHQRRLFYVADSLRKAMKEGDDCRDALKAVNRTIKLLEIVRYWMERLVDDKEFQWRPKDGETSTTSPRRVWDEVKRAFQDLLQPPMAEVPATYEVTGGDPAKQLDKKALNKVHAAFGARFEAIDVTHLQPPQAGAKTLLHAIDGYERSMVDFFGGVAKKAYDEFVEVDVSLFPIQFFSGTEERENVKVTRISPADANLGLAKCSLKSKLAGDVFHHFGGFFKRAWRSNDILWGRVDAVSQIIQTLLTQDNLTKNRAVNEIDAAYLKSCFPSASETAIETLRAAIHADSPDADALRKQLAELEQIEILRQEIPNVLADEELERETWENPKNATDRNALKKRADELIAGMSEAQLLDYFAPEKNDPKYYNFGNETLDDIDPEARNTTVLHATIVTHRALGDSAPENLRNAAVASNIHRWVDRNIRTFGASWLLLKKLTRSYRDFREKAKEKSLLARPPAS
jgi:patatin-related protein